jgi:hypothetical protein
VSKILKAIAEKKHIHAVDDERDSGGCIVITLMQPWCYTNDDGCGVQGFESVREAMLGTQMNAVYLPQISLAVASKDAPYE